MNSTKLGEFFFEKWNVDLTEEILHFHFPDIFFYLWRYKLNDVNKEYNKRIIPVTHYQDTWLDLIDPETDEVIWCYNYRPLDLGLSIPYIFNGFRDEVTIYKKNINAIYYYHDGVKKTAVAKLPENYYSRVEDFNMDVAIFTFPADLLINDIQE